MIRPRLHLDFIAARRPWRALGFVILAAALVPASVLISRYERAMEKLRAIEATDTLVRSARPAPEPRREQLDQQMKSAQAVQRRLALPWAELIESLERASMPEIALLQIQPDAAQRSVRVSAEARSEEMMLEYLRRLGARGYFSEVHLLSHQVREDAPERPIQFAAQASFRSLQ